MPDETPARTTEINVLMILGILVIAGAIAMALFLSGSGSLPPEYDDNTAGDTVDPEGT